MAFLTESEKLKVQEAVTSAETHTAGELVVVLSRRSSDYAVPRAAMAASLTVAVALEAAYLFPDLPLWAVLLGQFPLGVCFYWLSGLGVILRLIVPKRVRAEVVEERALSAFLQAGVTETRDRSGVLIFLSEAEHRAVIVADRGINQVVPPGEWQTDVDSLVAAIRSGSPAQGLLSAIERIGGILAEAFPARHDNTNELSNAVREV